MITEETYLYLNEETRERIEKFTIQLWKSDINPIYSNITNKRIRGERVEETVEDFVKDITPDIDTRLILGQGPIKEKIRYLTANEKDHRLEFCCEDTVENRQEIEPIFRKNFGYRFDEYPRKQII